MINRSQIEKNARNFSSFYNNYNDALSGEACFIFEHGMSNLLEYETRLWLQTYLPSEVLHRSRLVNIRSNAFHSLEDAK